MDVAVADGVERDIDPPGVPGHRVGVLIDGRFVEGVDLGGLGGPSRGGDLPGSRLDGLP